MTSVEALIAARRLDEATDVARSALARGGLPAGTKATLRLRLSSILEARGEFTEAVAEAEAVLAETDLPDQLYTAAELARLGALIADGNFGLARQQAEAILAGSDQPGADAALAGALNALGWVAFGEGRVADTIGLFRAAVQRADRGPSEARRNYPRFGLAYVLSATGEFGEAETLIRHGREQIELLGDKHLTAVPAFLYAHLRLAEGRLDDAAAEAQVGLAIAEELGAVYAEPQARPLARSILASVALLRGDLSEAAQHIGDDGGEQPSSLPSAFSLEAHTWVDARFADTAEGPARAVEILADVYDEPGAHKRLFLEEPAAAAWLARTALAVDDRERGEMVGTAAELLAADNPGFASVAASAAHARGLLDGDPATLDRAAVGHRHPWAQASAREDAGVALANRSKGRAARDRLERALAGYENMGADRDAARVRARLGELGVAAQRSQAIRSVSGWAGLTQTQRSVADLVATGLTNREVAGQMFLSRHTVDFHLRQIFRKLGVTSRVELTQLLLRRRRGGGEG